jgi:hypothetical protein
MSRYSTSLQKNNQDGFSIYNLSSNDKSKAICAHHFITNSKLTAEDTDAQTYLSGDIVMNAWNDLVQCQMQMEEPNFSNNVMLILSREFINLLYI